MASVAQEQPAQAQPLSARRVFGTLSLGVFTFSFIANVNGVPALAEYGLASVAFLRLVPCFGEDPGYSLDLMQRDPDAVNGITEFLIANAALALGERGFRRLSMNFAAWGRLFDATARLSFSERAQKRVAEALNPYFQIKSLRDFNAKFDPEWVPRSIVVESPAAMPKVGVLYASVEGFLSVPVVGRYLVPAVRSAS